MRGLEFSALNGIPNNLTLELITQNFIGDHSRELYTHCLPAPKHIQIMLRGRIENLRRRPRRHPILLFLEPYSNVDGASRRPNPQAPEHFSLLPVNNPLPTPLPPDERNRLPLNPPIKRIPVIRRTRIKRIEFRSVRPTHHNLPAGENRPRFDFLLPRGIGRIIPKYSARRLHRPNRRIPIIDVRLRDRPILSELIIPYHRPIRVRLTDLWPTKHDLIPVWIHEDERIDIVDRINRIIEETLISIRNNTLIRVAVMNENIVLRSKYVLRSVARNRDAARSKNTSSLKKSLEIIQKRTPHKSHSPHATFLIHKEITPKRQIGR